MGYCVSSGSGVWSTVALAVRGSDVNEAQRLGADATVDTGPELEVEVRGRWEDGVDACIDTIGLGAYALVCVRDGGTFATSVPSAVPDPARGITPQTVQVQPDADALAGLARAADAGGLTVRVAEVLPLERFRDAYTRLASGGLHGKLILSP